MIISNNYQNSSQVSNCQCQKSFEELFLQEPQEILKFSTFDSPNIFYQERFFSSQDQSISHTAQETYPKELAQNSLDEQYSDYYKQNSRTKDKNQTKKNIKKEKCDEDELYLPNKRKKIEQLGKNFLPNFTKPFLNLLMSQLDKNNIESLIFNKHKKVEALNWKILLEFFQESQLHLPILNIFMRNVKLECLLSKTKQKKVMMEHFKQLRKLKKRLIFILENKIGGSIDKNEQFRYSKGYNRGQIPMDS